MINPVWKILSGKFSRVVRIKVLTPLGIQEVSIKAGSDRIYQKLCRARDISEKTGMPIHGWTTVKKREWHAHQLGRQIAPVTGERGYYGAWQLVDDYVPNLLTTPGRDDFIDKCYIHNGAGSAAGNWIALSNDATAPSTGDTTLAGEITSNGLSRAQATTRTHTTGQNDWSLQYTWTATGAQSAQKAGLFNASSVGTLSHENTFASVTLATNDQLQLTWSGTLG